MKKKLMAMVLGLFSLFVLVACSSDNLDGEYYLISQYFIDDVDLEMVIKGDSGTYTIDGQDYPITAIDESKKQITINGNGRDYIITYDYEDSGKMVLNDTSTGGSSGVIFYKKDSKAYKEELERVKEKLKSEKSN